VRAKATDKVLGRTSPSPSSAPMHTSGAPAHATPDCFTDLLSLASSITNDGKSYISNYYPDLTSYTHWAARLNEHLEILPSHISEAIKLLCINNDGSSTLDFHGIPVSKSTIFSVISRLEESVQHIQHTERALNRFYESLVHHRTLYQDRAGAENIERQLNNLSTNINTVLTELRSL
jgi:hypothetical protein